VMLSEPLSDITTWTTGPGVVIVSVRLM
jgi:hypothetical protein